MTEFKKLDTSKPVQTRDGRPARILCTDLNNYPTSGFPIVAAVMRPEDNREEIFRYSIWGSLRLDGLEDPIDPQPEDLLNVPEGSQPVFVNVYETKQPCIHPNLESARRGRSLGCRFLATETWVYRAGNWVMTAREEAKP